MNPVLLDLGFVKIYWYSVMILLGIFIGGNIALKEAKRYKLTEDYMSNMILYLIIYSILGARIYYVIFNWEYYGNNIVDIFKIWEGGLAIHGGLIAGILFIIYYTRKYKVNTMRMFDILCVGVIIGQAIGRWGNFFNGEAHGTETSLKFLQSLHLPDFIIDGMNIYGIYYHPTFLYESLWCLLGFIILLIFRRLYYTKIGQIMGLYLVWYGIGRFFIEGLRTDSLMFGEYRMAQIASICMIVAGLIIMLVKNSGSKLDNRYNDLGDVDEVQF